VLDGYASGNLSKVCIRNLKSAGIHFRRVQGKISLQLNKICADIWNKSMAANGLEPGLYCLELVTLKAF
jgi:hypothetical protein